MRRVAGWTLALLLAGCGGRIVPPTSGTLPNAGPASNPSRGSTARQPIAAIPIAPAPAAIAAGAVSASANPLVLGPAVASLPLDDGRARAALAAFRTTCPSLVRRTDRSGLTRGADWRAVCDAAAAGSEDARAFFDRWFETVQVGDGRAFATGYYEPEIAGSRERGPGFEVPIHARPRDLIEVDLGLFSADLKGKKVRGRVSGTALVPYDDRTAIEEGSLDGRARVLAWAADPVEVFFLQVQGSGRLRLPDGRVMRIGYDGQNGRDYTGIGALMRTRGLLAPGQTSMQGIVAWLHAHPIEGRALMRENRSYVFFRELDGAPLGALGLPVTGRVSAAGDARFVPLGAPVFLSMDRTDATGLWVVQDTGGAIKGANRFDTFWGAGEEARAIAGGMSAHGTAFLLLPRGTVARLQGEGRGTPARP